MAVQTTGFKTFQKQLDLELHSLSSESKRRNTSIKHASDKSIEILKTIQNIEDLASHPDFVTPLVESCLSRNAKLTSIAMQCLQGLASAPSIPESRLSGVLDGFIEATHLAIEIQLKVLQIVPLFFKTYAKYIKGPLCGKLLQCCSNLLQLPNKAPVVFGTASATLQQLIDEIFERLTYNWDTSDSETFDVLINNNESIKVNAYHYDANRLFNDLCSLLEAVPSSGSSDTNEKNVLLNLNDIQIDYGLEILESVLKNSKSLFITNPDLKFLLRIKAIPLLLRCISSSKVFSTIFRSTRCIKLLITKEYIPILELELEVILSLLIHGISTDSNLSPWQRVLSLELFKSLSEDFEIIYSIYMTYDNFQDKKHIITDLLQACFKLMKSDEFNVYLALSDVIQKTEASLISSDNSKVKTKYIDMLDKVHPPPVNLTYIIWLVLNISNNCSDGLSEYALDATQVKSANNAEKEEDSPKGKILKVYNGLFESLFEIHVLFLYSSSLDSHLFHSLVRAFQKLTHGTGFLLLSEKLDKCLHIFTVAIVDNVSKLQPNTQPKGHKRNSSTTSTISKSTVFNAISESLIGQTNTQKDNTLQPSERKLLHSRSLNSKQISIFRALLSLSISLGSGFRIESWQYLFLTWQWVSYYIYGPSADFMETSYSHDIPPMPTISKMDINSIETSITKLFESTRTYTYSSYNTVLKSLMIDCKDTLSLTHGTDTDKGYHPITPTGAVSHCVYNRGFFITQIGELASFNFSRFLIQNENKNKDLWNATMKFFVALIADRSISSTSLRLYVTRIFTDIIKKVTNDIGSMEDQDSRSAHFTILEDLVTNTLMETIDSIKQLEITKTEIYDGTINVESEILFQLLSTLKDILNEFGDLLTHSWATVFKTINAPFEWVVDEDLISKYGKEDDSSLVEGIIQKHKDMIQVSYDVFKLISDDFLQSLPLEVIKCVIDTLVNFVGQEDNLNISFSSISQFWLVGDYLRVRFNSEVQFDQGKAEESKFQEIIKDKRLTEVITSYTATPWEIYNGLWLYLLKSLISCTQDKRTEVKNGTIQTFFRIVDSHASCFPTWDLIFFEVLKPFLDGVSLQGNDEQIADFADLTLKGLVNLYPAYFNDFGSSPNVEEAWKDLLNFIQKLLSSSTVDINFVTITNYHNLLKEMWNIPEVPEPIWKMCHNIWCGYNITYSDLAGPTKEFKTKTEYDCICELIILFPDLYKLACFQVQWNYRGFYRTIIYSL